MCHGVPKVAHQSVLKGTETSCRSTRSTILPDTDSQRSSIPASSRGLQSSRRRSRRGKGTHNSGQARKEWSCSWSPAGNGTHSSTLEDGGSGRARGVRETPTTVNQHVHSQRYKQGHSAKVRHPPPPPPATPRHPPPPPPPPSPGPRQRQRHARTPCRGVVAEKSNRARGARAWGPGVVGPISALSVTVAGTNQHKGRGGGGGRGLGGGGNTHAHTSWNLWRTVEWDQLVTRHTATTAFEY